MLDEWVEMALLRLMNELQTSIEDYVDSIQTIATIMLASYIIFSIIFYLVSVLNLLSLHKRVIIYYVYIYIGQSIIHVFGIATASYGDNE